ncbi:MAG: LPS-assembly protein LptD [Deltaproteobacteria bacterium]|nr:LPS-assembly protein LptD [Deltaproteobacteria bacterium]MBN2686607.1 LPS-assembly protein LptD [Deltaproteobacteria bacterium]
MRIRNVILILVVCVAIRGMVHPAAAFDTAVPKGPVNLEANTVTYDSEKDNYTATGDVEITFEGGYLKADAVEYNRTTGDAAAEGNVVIMHNKDLLYGDSGHFNLTSKTGDVDNGRLFFEKNHFYLTGTKIEKTGEASYFLRDATASTCDGELPDWRFTGKELNVTVDGYGTLKHGTFQVKNWPLIYLPYVIFPAKTTRQSGLLYPRIAYSSDKHGWDVGIPFYWAMSDNADATFYQRYMDKRGFQEGVEFRYCISEDSFGTFYGEFLNDSRAQGISDENEDPLQREWTDNQHRWSYYLNHETTFSPGFYFRTDIIKISDVWYFRDFDDYNYYLDHYDESGTKRFDKVSFLADKSITSLESTARLVKNWDMYNVTTLVQYTDNLQSYSNDSTLQKYPEVTVTGVTQPIAGTPFNYALTSQYDYYYRTEGYRGHYFDMHPIVSLPLRYRDYFRITPQVGVRETSWDSAHSKESTPGKRGYRELYDLGATASTEIHRIFNIGGESVQMIRHGIQTDITYAYIPYVYQGDRADYVDVVSEENTITYSLTNTLIARLADEEGNRSYNEFFRLKLSQIYDLKEARRSTTAGTRDRRPFGPVDMELNVDPFKYLSFYADASFDVNAGEWKETNYDATVSDWRGDSLTLEYRYTQKTLEEINLNLKACITDALQFNYMLRKNEFDKKVLETLYSIDYTSQCWAVQLTYTDTPDDRKFMIIMSLYGLGKVGRAEAKPENIRRRE